MLKIITLTGDLGSGKSTVSAILCRQLGYDYIYTGKIQRDLALKYGMTTVELNRYAETHPEIDHEIDATFKSLSQSSHLVVDSRLAWFFLPDSFKVFLKTDIAVATDRIFHDTKRLNETYETPREAMQNLLERKKSENLRYRTLYGADCENLCNFDLTLDTSKDTPEEVAEKIIVSYQKWLENN